MPPWGELVKCRVLLGGALVHVPHRGAGQVADVAGDDGLCLGQQVADRGRRLRR